MVKIHIYYVLNDLTVPKKWYFLEEKVSYFDLFIDFEIIFGCKSLLLS